MKNIFRDLLIIGGIASFVSGMGMRFGIPWALISGGILLMLFGVKTRVAK